MRYYQPNPACGCGRCSTRGLMGPAVLITLGLLFLISNSSPYGFERTWPILLIVIGAIKVTRYVINDEGHINPEQFPPGATYGQYPPGQYPPPPYQYPAPQGAGFAQSPTGASGPVVTPPPAPVAGELGNGEVHDG